MLGWNLKRMDRKMLNLGSVITLTAVFLLAGVAQAEEPPNRQVQSQAGFQAGNAEDWARTHLVPAPSLREQIGKARSFFEEKAPELDQEMSRLKDQGVLDRRSASKIRNALHHARSAVTEIADRIDANERIDGWTARMTSYELGMAADALTKQADAVATAMSSAGEEPSTLSITLREGSSLSKETARAIVHYLK